ncbi:MAG: methyltransferase domain-containing protein [Pseudomonadota bacterium]|nr:methyltransferase domain-containing protein [Pseudomonadota bacterium]
MNYYLAAAALRAFSATAPTRALYRWLGNRKTVRKLSEDKAGWVLDRIAETQLSASPRFLELGTGWMHAYSLWPALLHDAEVCCFDVWDNRSFGALKNAVPQLVDGVQRMARTPEQAERARAKIALLEKATSFDEAYRTLNLHYAIDGAGRLPWPDAHFDVIYSVDVLEHVSGAAFDSACADWFRALRPGGRFVAQVGLDDHLAHYDPSRSKKHYLRHSDRLFRNFLENDVQYINRLPASRILASLEAAGFRLRDTEYFSVEAATLRVHPDYAAQSEQDARAWRLHLVAERPAD